MPIPQQAASTRELHDLIYPGQMLVEAESLKIPVQEE